MTKITSKTIVLETVKIEISNDTKGADKLYYAIYGPDEIERITSGKFLNGEDINQVHAFENSAQWIKADYVLYLDANEHTKIVDYLVSIDVKGLVTVVQQDVYGNKKTLKITL